MENNKIDRLFHDNLEGMEITPSARAYNQFESLLGKKNKRIYFRYAAGIAGLLLVLSGSFFLINDLQKTVTLENRTGIDHTVSAIPAEETIQIRESITEEKPQIPAKETLITDNRKVNTTVSPDLYQEAKKPSLDLPVLDNRDSLSLAPILLTEVMNENPPGEIIEAIQPVLAEVTDDDTLPEKEGEIHIPTGITIEYFSDKNLKKNKKIKNTLNRLVAQTQQLKSPEELYGDIRNLKDELLAFNFIKSKNNSDSK